ncbi:MAG: ankyrin repeat domain-containing protein, partial [Verrucomicrobia bacterium]|nr:ankyrin repeat domain-containing protein [Verrucomicrobiota bacterium]
MIKLQGLHSNNNIENLNRKILIPESEHTEEINRLAFSSMDSFSTNLNSNRSNLIKKIVCEKNSISESKIASITTTPFKLDDLQFFANLPNIDTNLQNITTFTGIYSESELFEYFHSLRKVLESSKTPILFKLSNIGKELSIGYDPLEKSWVLINSDSTFIEKVPDDSFIAEKVFSLFCVDNNSEIVMLTKALCLEDSLFDFQNTLSIWKNTPIFKKTHETNETKVHSILDDTSWLYLAARSGDIESVERLIKAGANINKAKLNGLTALMAASFFGHIEVVKKLLEAGADVNLVNSNHETALRLAIEKNHTEIFPLLYAKGATRNLFHKDVQHLMKSFGYRCMEGVCHGIAHKSIEAFLLGEVDIFNSRLENIITLIEK